MEKIASARALWAAIAAPMSVAVVTLSLAAGPSLARPLPVMVQTPVAAFPQPQLPAQYSPSVLDLGTLRAYKNEQHTATLAVTAPAAGTVFATTWPLQSPFHVTQMTRFAPSGLGRIVSRVSPLETVGPGGEVHAQAGDQIVIEVALQSTPTMRETLTGELDTGSKQWYIQVPIKAFVVQQPEIVPAIDNAEYKIVPGGSQSVTVHLNRTRTQSFTGPSGVNQEVTISGRRTPNGISVDPVTLRVPADVLTVDAVVTLHASPGTAVGPGQATTLVVAYSGESQSLDLTANVYPPSVTWHYDFQVGDVHHVGDMTIRSDGTWKWKAHLHDRGTIYGDYYSVVIWLNIPYSNDGTSSPGGYQNGQLGGGVFGGSQDADIEKSSDQPNLDPYYNPAGPSQALRNHYIEAVDAGFQVWGNASDDPSPLMKWVFEKGASIVGGAFGL